MNYSAEQLYYLVGIVGTLGTFLSGVAIWYLGTTFVRQGRFNALERRVETTVAQTTFDELSKRVATVEHRCDNNASAAELAALTLSLEKINGTWGRMDERMKAMTTQFEGIKQSVDRVENYLLSAGK